VLLRILSLFFLGVLGGLVVLFLRLHCGDGMAFHLPDKTRFRQSVKMAEETETTQHFRRQN
jgi:hypothetical protein